MAYSLDGFKRDFESIQAVGKKDIVSTVYLANSPKKGEVLWKR